MFLLHSMTTAVDVVLLKEVWVMLCAVSVIWLSLTVSLLVDTRPLEKGDLKLALAPKVTIDVLRDADAGVGSGAVEGGRLVHACRLPHVRFEIGYRAGSYGCAGAAGGTTNAVRVRQWWLDSTAPIVQ